MRDYKFVIGRLTKTFDLKSDISSKAIFSCIPDKVFHGLTHIEKIIPYISYPTEGVNKKG